MASKQPAQPVQPGEFLKRTESRNSETESHKTDSRKPENDSREPESAGERVANLAIDMIAALERAMSSGDDAGRLELIPQLDKLCRIVPPAFRARDTALQIVRLPAVSDGFPVAVASVASGEASSGDAEKPICAVGDAGSDVQGGLTKFGKPNSARDGGGGGRNTESLAKGEQNCSVDWKKPEDVSYSKGEWGNAVDSDESEW